MTKSRFKTLLSCFTNILRNKDYWLCFIAGLSLVLAYAPFSQWYIVLLIPAIVFHKIQQQTPRKAAKLIGIFSFGWFASGISWIHVSIDQFGGLPLAVSLSLMLLLCFYLALFSALAAYLTAKCSSKQQLNLWLLPSFWLISEYLRSVVLTGFPWLSLGYSQIDSPLASFAPLIGEVGISALVITINICLVKIFNSIKLNNNQNIAFPIMLIFSLGILSYIFSKITWVQPTGQKTKIALIQGNIEQSIKWAPEQEWPTMLKYLDLTRMNYDADIIIWPESAIPTMEPTAQDYLTTVNRSALLNNSAIITGIINYNFESREYFNSLIVLGNKQRGDEQGYYYNHSNRYSKNHLLPIGEFVPFQEWLRPLAPLFSLPQSSFTRGQYVQKNLIANDLHILPLLCFEIAFPHQLAANLTNQTDLLLTVSNDAWFGNSHGPHQHMEIARMRALEFGRPLLRSTNNGITAVVDHQGEFIDRIPQFQERVLKAEVPLVSGKTPYSQRPRLILVLITLVPLIIIKVLDKKVLTSH